MLGKTSKIIVKILFFIFYFKFSHLPLQSQKKYKSWLAFVR
jgi:hypothetical protein